MDDLRWILVVLGLVLIAAIFFSGRFEREEWKRDRDRSSRFPKPAKKSEDAPRPVSNMREEPRITIEEDEVKTINTIEKKSPHLSKSVEKGITQKKENPWPVEEIKKTEINEPKITAKPAATQSVGIRSEEDVKHALGISGQEVGGEPEAKKAEKQAEKINQEEMEQTVKEDWKGVVNSARDPLIEDEIEDVKIPEEKINITKKSDEDVDLELKNEPVQQDLLLEIEPLVLVLTVMAKDDTILDGSSIKRVLEGSGLQCGEDGIFHFHMTGKKNAVFSVVSTIEPGIFDMATINEYETPGLSFFCQLPGHLTKKDMLRIMQMKALNIAEKLGGKLCDDRRNLLTEQALSHYNDRIIEFDREMVLAKKKQG